ncbi:MAG TPA: hypothetical protein VKC60_16705 [Opitutaceae bacterium]|nr:hypothetical protein [Opitutaceae bacterium]
MQNQTYRSKTGSSLLIVLIFSTIMLLLVGSLVNWSVTERRLTYRDALRLESRNGAESAAEIGLYQIYQKLQQSSVTSAGSTFTPTGSNALTLPTTTVANFFQGSHINTTTATTSSTLLEVMAGPAATVTTSGGSYYVDPSDPNNANDPLKGKYVNRYDIPVYARASALSPSGGAPITSFVKETLSVRSANLFAHAIFYNMDLEIFPGPTMTISGPVHSNGSIYISSQGNSLNFQDVVTCVGNVYHAWKSVNPSAEGSGSETLGTSPVYFPSSVTPSVLVNINNSGTWDDSTMGTSSSITPSSFSNSQAGQSSYLSSLSAAASTATAAAAFRNYSGTTWKGNVLTSVNDVQVYNPVAIGSYAESTGTTSATDNSQNSAHALIEPSLASTDPNYNSETEAQKISSKATLYIKVVPGTHTLSTVTTGSTVTTTTVTLTSPTITLSVITSSGSVSSALSSLPPGLINAKQYTDTTVTTSSNSTSTVSNGMYDQRQKAGLDLIEIDMNALRNAVAQMAGTGTNASAAIPGLTTSAQSSWSGVVYVEVAGLPTTIINGSLSGQTTYPTNNYDPTAVRLIDTGNSGNGGFVASYGSINPGLTIATNAPVYIKGNYNVDPNATGSTSATVAQSGEPPACIAGDAITVLSSGFTDSSSKRTNKPSSSVDVSISAAFLTGMDPTNKNTNNASSGGAHNLPRFLEAWNNTVHIRGSLVCLYESRDPASTAPWSTGVYGAPTRDWGFNSLFKNGSYPPGTPNVISFRRINYNFLTKTQYQATHVSLFGY